MDAVSDTDAAVLLLLLLLLPCTTEHVHGIMFDSVSGTNSTADACAVLTHTHKLTHRGALSAWVARAYSAHTPRLCLPGVLSALLVAAECQPASYTTVVSGAARSSNPMEPSGLHSITSRLSCTGCFLFHAVTGTGRNLFAQTKCLLDRAGHRRYAAVKGDLTAAAGLLPTPRGPLVPFPLVAVNPGLGPGRHGIQPLC